MIFNIVGKSLAINLAINLIIHPKQHDSDTKKTLSRPTSQNTLSWVRDGSRRRILNINTLKLNALNQNIKSTVYSSIQKQVQ